MQNLNLRYSYLYFTTDCASCKQTEDILHLFNCPLVKTSLINSICKIITQTKQEEVGYKIQVEWPTDLRLNKLRNISMKMEVIAYADDT
ncbi:5016_t:CDS:1, partial [Gigaspora margarita]